MDAVQPPIKSAPVRKPLRALAACGLIAAAGFGAWALLGSRRAKAPAPEPKPAAAAVAAPAAAHAALPDEIRGIYLTASTASSPQRYAKIVAAAKAKGANAVVLDLKGDMGHLAFEPKSEALRAAAPIKKLYDLDATAAATHEAGLYLIARIPFFEDPAYADAHPAVALHRPGGGLWRDAKGLRWLDPAAEGVWDYGAALAEEAYARGCDEVQFDYIRFATDGKTSQISFPAYDAKRETKREAIGRLFDYLDGRLRRQGIPMSVDVFGFVTWHQNDLGIGQWYADALAHFDFVSPMVYPSHYPAGTLGYKNPAEHPYEIVADSLRKGREVVEAVASGQPPAHPGSQRPWLQAFSLGAKYTPEMILAQIKAARESGASGFLLWNAGNDYSALPDLNPKANI